MAVSQSHRLRIKRELTKAGMTAYGQLKMSSRHLPETIAKNEHIEGVVYGWRGGGLAMLVATNERIIYLERRPLFASVDDVSYDVVAGVRLMNAGFFHSINLHTRMGDYVLTYVNPRCAQRFTQYIESRIERLPGQSSYGGPAPAKDEPAESDQDVPAPTAVPLAPEARQFLKKYEVGVLATANRTGQAYGSAVYYVLGSDDLIYILTKSETTKARNMSANDHVSFTVFDPAEIKTAQIKALAEIETDYESKRQIFEQLAGFRSYGGKVTMPPVAKLSAGGFIVFRLTPFDVRYTDYQAIDGGQLKKSGAKTPR